MSLDLYKNALYQSLLREMFTLVLKKSKSELKYFSHVFNLYLTLWALTLMKKYTKAVKKKILYASCLEKQTY